MRKMSSFCEVGAKYPLAHQTTLEISIFCYVVIGKNNI